MTAAENPDEPKIVVDDDYKNRVQQEKEQLQKEMEAQSAAGTNPDDMEMPPASFAMLVTTLATQALSSLGHLPDVFEVDVAYDFSIDDVDADVKYYSSRLHHVASQELRTTYSDAENICCPGETCQVLGVGVTNCDCCIRLLQQVSEGPPHSLASAHHYCVFSS